MNYLEFIALCRTKNPAQFEVHHIEPLSIGGVDVSANRIKLTERDHYNAHKLLALEHPYNLKLWQAWWEVYVTRNVKNKKDYMLIRNKLSELPILNSKETRKRKSEATRKYMASLNETQRNEFCRKISEANRRTYTDPQRRKKVSDGLKKKWTDPEYREKVVQSRRSRTTVCTHTQEFKDKMREAHLGKRWFTNGIQNILDYNCPDGFRPGITRGLKNV